MQENFSTRLSQALTLRKIKPIELSEKTGLPKSGISQYLSGVCIPKNKNIRKIAEALNINPDWLLGYSIQMETKQESNVFPTTDIPEKIPVLGKISAGLPILAVENIEDFQYAPSSKIQEGYDYFYLRVQR